MKLVGRQRLQTRFDSLMFSPDGRYLAAGETNGSGMSDVYLYSTARLRLVRRLYGCTDYADLAFSPDSRFVYGCAYGVAFKWRTSDGRRVAAWAPFGSTEIVDELFNSSGEMAVSGNVLDFLVGEFRGRQVVADPNFRTFQTRRISPETATFRPFRAETRLLALQKRSVESLTIVDLVSGRALNAITEPEVARVKDADSTDVKVSPDGELLAARTLDRSRIQIWPTFHPDQMLSINPPGDMVGQDFYFVNNRLFAMTGPGDLVDPKTGKVLVRFVADGSDELKLLGPGGATLNSQALAEILAR